MLDEADEGFDMRLGAAEERGPSRRSAPPSRSGGGADDVAGATAAPAGSAAPAAASTASADSPPADAAPAAAPLLSSLSPPSSSSPTAAGLAAPSASSGSAVAAEASSASPAATPGLHDDVASAAGSVEMDLDAPPPPPFDDAGLEPFAARKRARTDTARLLRRDLFRYLRSTKRCDDIALAPLDDLAPDQALALARELIAEAARFRKSRFIEAVGRRVPAAVVSA